jgi:hypothetical protein
MRLEIIRSIEKSNNLIGNRTHEHPPCKTIPQPTTLPRASMATIETYNKLEVGLCKPISWQGIDEKRPESFTEYIYKSHYKNYKHGDKLKLRGYILGLF